MKNGNVIINLTILGILLNGEVFSSGKKVATLQEDSTEGSLIIGGHNLRKPKTKKEIEPQPQSVPKKKKTTRSKRFSHARLPLPPVVDQLPEQPAQVHLPQNHEEQHPNSNVLAPANASIPHDDNPDPNDTFMRLRHGNKSDREIYTDQKEMWNNISWVVKASVGGFSGIAGLLSGAAAIIQDDDNTKKILSWTSLGVAAGAVILKFIDEGIKNKLDEIKDKLASIEKNGAATSTQQKIAEFSIKIRPGALKTQMDNEINKINETKYNPTEQEKKHCKREVKKLWDEKRSQEKAAEVLNDEKYLNPHFLGPKALHGWDISHFLKDKASENVTNAIINATLKYKPMPEPV